MWLQRVSFRAERSDRHCFHGRWRRGTAMVEFAVAGALFFLFSIGIVETARAIGIYEEITNAAREGTRYGVAHSPTSLSPASSSDIQNYVISKATGLDANSLTISVSWPQDQGNPDLTDVEVQVSYPYSPAIPFMQGVTLHLTTQSRMVIWTNGGSTLIQ